MIKKISLAVLLSSISATYAEQGLEIHESTHAARLIQRDCGICGSDDNCTIDESCNSCLIGPRGPRGHRGHSGRRGATGNTGATGATGVNSPSSLSGELFINAPMMANEVGETPDTLFINTYGAQTTIDAWQLVTEGDSNPANVIGAQFVIPSSLDATQPVTLIIHCLNQFVEGSVGSIVLTINADYKSAGEELGIVAPETGYAETISTPAQLIVDPTGTNLRYFTFSVPLNPALLAGKTWGFITINRGFTGSSPEYFAPIFLTELSVQYTKISS